MKQPITRGPSRAELEAQNKRRRSILYASLGVVIVVMIVAVLSRNPQVQNASTAPQQAAINVGDTAPQFAISTTAGPFDLKSSAGKPVLLEVFATWCPHCQRMTTVLDDLYKKYGTKVNFVAVSGAPAGMDGSTPESQADVIAFQQRFKVQYPVAFDPNLDVANKYLQSGFPTIVLIDAKGKIATIGSGEIPEASLAKNLEAAATGGKIASTFS
jgi:thiol-disulfide isomerase/thioredoxin